ncbi:putative inactive receptor kinase [Vitis vinifera]|uniref:Putative inactive receptor kinase n=1 Tax=Vitis vinifera TaxID=29760 RepID=A0A438F4X0_VITVI|nr:putative inactive receptor kinase [Vitis vinifera]
MRFLGVVLPHSRSSIVFNTCSKAGPDLVGSQCMATFSSHLFEDHPSQILQVILQSKAKTCRGCCSVSPHGLWSPPPDDTSWHWRADSKFGALGYRAPELAMAGKPVPSFKADVYAFGVILMELLTRRSAGDIISGQSGAVDLTDWVRLCDQEGRGMDCFDRDIADGEEPSKAMDELLAVSLKCILPVNERPNIRQVCDDLCSISI